MGGEASPLGASSDQGDIVIIAIKNRIREYRHLYSIFFSLPHSLYLIPLTLSTATTSSSLLFCLAIILTLCFTYSLCWLLWLPARLAVGERKKDGTYKPTLGDILVHFAVQLADGSWHICEVCARDRERVCV